MIVLYILLLLCVLYILALQGRRNHPLWSCFRAQRFAHRGYHDKPQIPENSLPAFRRAIAHGWGAELDVHLLKDGTLAVFHDSSLSRCTGAQGMIEDLTFEELRALRLEAQAAKKSPAAEKLFRWLRLNQWISVKAVGWLPLTLYDKTQWNRPEWKVLSAPERRAATPSST